jgi:sulfur carrier protein ThiS
MSIKLIIRKEEYIIEPAKNLSVKKAMEHLNILPEAYLAVRNGEILIEHEHLHDGDIIKFVPVISGG